MTHLLVFLSAALYEVVFLMWADSAHKRRPYMAAFYSAGVGALSLFGVWSVIGSPGRGLSAALLLGYAFGSFVTVKWLSE